MMGLSRDPIGTDVCHSSGTKVCDFLNFLLTELLLLLSLPRLLHICTEHKPLKVYLP